MMGEEREEKNIRKRTSGTGKKDSAFIFTFNRDMAEARLANLSLGGYEEAFVNEVDEDLLCPICQSPLKEPLLTKCGHRFCRRCLEEHIDRFASLHFGLILKVHRSRQHCLKKLPHHSYNCNITAAKQRRV